MKKLEKKVSVFKSMAAEWKWLLKYILNYKKEVFLYIVVGVFGIAMGLGSSVASKYLIDAVVSPSKDLNEIITSASMVIGMAVMQIFINSATSRLTTVVGTRINTQIRSKIYENIVFSNWEEINKYHSGELINRLEGDANVVSNSIISFVPNVFTRVTQFVGCIIIVLVYCDPIMVVLALMSAPFFILSSRFTTKMMRKFSIESREMNGKILSYGEESMQNLQTIKAFDLTKQYTRNFKVLLEAYRKVKLDYDKFSIILSICMSLIGLLVSYSCYGWGVYLLFNNGISFGEMTLLLQISGSLTSAFTTLVALVPSAITIATAAGRIMEVTTLSSEKDKDCEKALSMLQKANEEGIRVTADNVTYTYKDGDKAVINNASFEASPGETIALIGPSGEGKTTLLRLILGLMEPDSGCLEMSVGNEKLKISDSTRRFCSYVPQGNTVFSGSIKENLMLVNEDATDEDIIEALKIADAWDFIRVLPLGIDTVIGERGVNFSEGQVQRISIARAVLRKANVLIMDEATSALDSETEGKVLTNLMESNPLRTCIITTHRPSMLQYCDRIYKIDENGSLVLSK